MPVRRLNYTNRKKINLSDIRISISDKSASSVSFDADMTLSEYGLPKDALVFIEAYRQTSWMRFGCGTAGDIQLPADRQLTEFDSPEGILFRVRVTSVKDPAGLLLAEADRIRPQAQQDEDSDRVPLLPARAENIGHRIFRVDLTDNPILVVNSGLPNWKSAIRGPVFISLVYPAVMRQILTHIFRAEGGFDPDEDTDGSGWRAQWIKFATALPTGLDFPAEVDQEQIDEWIEGAVDAFCRTNSVYNSFHDYLDSEG